MGLRRDLFEIFPCRRPFLVRLFAAMGLLELCTVSICDVGIYTNNRKITVPRQGNGIARWCRAVKRNTRRGLRQTERIRVFTSNSIRPRGLWLSHTSTSAPRFKLGLYFLFYFLLGIVSFAFPFLRAVCDPIRRSSWRVIYLTALRRFLRLPRRRSAHSRVPGVKSTRNTLVNYDKL